MPVNDIQAILGQPLFNAQGQDLTSAYQPFDSNQGQGDTVIRPDQLDQLPLITGRKALLLAETDSPADTAFPLAQLDTIIIHFDNFADGRGYSFARLLRRQGFKGELRAAGDVFKDVIFYLKRSGFDSFYLKPGKNAEDAKQGLHTFSHSYQADALRPQGDYQAGTRS